MSKITDPGVYTLPEPFDFDTIDEKVLKKLGRSFSGDENILLTCKKPIGVQVVSITVWDEGLCIFSCETLNGKYDKKALAPNPWHLIAFAKMQPDFIDNDAIATQWKGLDGKFRFLVSAGHDGERSVGVYEHDSEWDVNWLFSGS